MRFARQTNRRTQDVVAGLAGVTTDYLYQIERGKKLPTLPVLMALTEIFRLPVATLLAPTGLSAAAAPPRPKGNIQCQDYGSALVALQAASIEAPEDMTYRPAAHAVLHTVIQRGRATIARQGAALATRFNIVF